MPLDATHPIFHSFFEINTLDSSQGYYGPRRRSTASSRTTTRRSGCWSIANYNNDLGELWEFSDTGWVPIDLSNEAYKFGVNYIVYAMTH